MTTYSYTLIDQNTGEEVFASNDFAFGDRPAPGHRISDPELTERFGSTPVVSRVEDGKADQNGDVEVKVYIEGSNEILNNDNNDRDQSYARS